MFSVTLARVVAGMLLLGATGTMAVAQDRPKLAKASVSPSYVSIEGVWEPDNPNNMQVFGVTHIECFRTGGRDLVGTDSFCVVAYAWQREMISVDITRMKVVEWSKTELVMVDDVPTCSTSQTTIDLTSKTASDLETKKNAKDSPCKGFLDRYPDNQTYYLRDQLDYYHAHPGAKPGRQAEIQGHRISTLQLPSGSQVDENRAQAG